MTTDSASYTVTQDPTLLATTSFDFGFKLLPDVYETSVNLVSEPTRCNERVRFFLDVTNFANELEEGVLKFSVGPLSQVYTTIPQDSEFNEDTDQYLWYFENLDASEVFEVEILMDMPSEQSIGEQLIYNAAVLSLIHI